MSKGKDTITCSDTNEGTQLWRAYLSYQLSLKNMRDYNNVLRTAVEDAAAAALEKGLEKGLAKGLAKGKEIGREEGIEIGVKREREQLAARLRASGMSEAEINKLMRP